MKEIIQILNLEDNPNDAELIRERLRQEGVDCEIRRVDNKEDFITALDRGATDMVLADYTMPLFDGLSALEIALKKCPDTPFIFVSGTIGEDVAIEALKSGATDYVIKSKLSRLAPAVRRALNEAKERVSRRQAEAVLRKSEKWYVDLVEDARDAIFTLSTEGTILSLNPAFETITGWPRAEWLDKPFGPIVHPDDLPRVLELFQNALRGQQPPLFELRLLSGSGQDLLCELAATPQIKDGQVTSIMGIARDITGQRKTENALQESEKKYRNLVDNSSVGIYKTSLSGDILYANRAMAALFEFDSPEELLKEGIVKRFSNLEDRERLMDILGKNGKVDQIELEFLTKTGKIKTMLVSAVLEGNTISGMFIDSTERRQAEENLRRSEAFVKNVLESVNEGFTVVDLEHRIVSANKAYCTQVKLPLRDILGRHCYEVSHQKDRPCFLEGEECGPANTLKNGRTYVTIHTHYDDEGNTVYLETKSYPVKDESGKITAVIETFNDITEKKKLEGQLLQAQKMEAIGSLAGGVAHDFNNILNVIMGYGGLVLDKMEPHDPSREQMHEVLAAAERAATLTKQLLLFSRKQVVEMKAVDVKGVISGIQKMLSRVIGEDIELRVNLAGRPLTVMADAGQLEQVLMNLAVNARDAMPKGGHLMIETETAQMDEEYISAYGYGKPGAYAVITVADTGNGMDAETQRKIFEPFFTTKELGEGTGLGLAISYGILKQHNGYIKCYSEVGKGTAFKIYLPLIEDRESRIEGAASIDIKGGTETIFVAEDDPSLRKLARLILESFGYHVILAEDGEEAVMKYRENKDRIQLVILDLVMPRKSGKEAYEDIKAISPGVKVFFLSGYTMDMISRMELEAGMEVIRKPFAPKDLLKKVREVLDK